MWKWVNDYVHQKFLGLGLSFASPGVIKKKYISAPFFFLVQADAEQGADSPVRDEPLGEPGV